MADAGVVISMLMYDGDVFLGRVEVSSFLPEGEEMQPHNPFPTKEIRLSHWSPASGRCPPLAVLQVISPYAMRCKLQAMPDLPPGSGLHKLYYTYCFKERMTAVLEDGEEELHLVAMRSKMKGVPSFWCWSARSGLYSACLEMLNQHRIAIVFDLDETLVVSNSTKSFDNRMDRLSNLLDQEVDKDKELAMHKEFCKLFNDKELLEEFVDTECITVDGGIIRSKKEEVMLSGPGSHQKLIVRPVIRVPGRNVILTRINAKVPANSIFVNIRPCWDYFKSYLTDNGRQRFKIYVCTMAGRDYAVEMWRLLDPEGSLISLEDLSKRLICVKPDSKKSLQHVFQENLCHPSMAMVIDDRLEVWEEKDKRRVHVVRAYNPVAAPEDKIVNYGPHVLQILRSVVGNVRSGYFREFDGNLLKKVDELMYENEVLDLPYTPDVGDYLVTKGNYIVRHSNAPLPEDTSGGEAEGIVNRKPGPVGSSNGMVVRSENAFQPLTKGN